MLSYVHERMGKRSILVWTDVTMGALCVAAIGTSLLLDYVLTNTTGTPDQIAVAVAYPLFDVATIAVAIGAFALTGWRAGLGLGLVISVSSARRPGRDRHLPVGRGHLHGQRPGNLFLAPGTVLIALGAVQPSLNRREPPRTRVAHVASAGGVRARDFRPDDLQRQDTTADREVYRRDLVAIAARIIHLPARTCAPGDSSSRRHSLTGLANRGKLLFDFDHFDWGTIIPPPPAAHPRPGRLQGLQRRLGYLVGDSLLIRPPRPPAPQRGRSTDAPTGWVATSSR